MEGCGMSCIKYLLVVFNALFLIFGIVIISVAAVDMNITSGFAGMENITGNETDAILIAIGVLIIIIAAFGCFGAWKESPKLLYIFAGCLIVIILLELSVGVAAAALRPQFEETMKTQLRNSFYKNKSAKDEDSTHRDFWEKIQSTFECCGVHGPADYDPAGTPQYSCCMPEPESDKAQEIKHSECLNKGTFYQDGCETKVLGVIHSAGMSVIVTGLLFCFIEVAGIVLALWLAHAIKTEGKSRDTA